VRAEAHTTSEPFRAEWYSDENMLNVRSVVALLLVSALLACAQSRVPSVPHDTTSSPPTAVPTGASAGTPGQSKTLLIGVGVAAVVTVAILVIRRRSAQKHRKDSSAKTQPAATSAAQK
jgi:hypothetical protein